MPDRPTYRPVYKAIHRPLDASRYRSCAERFTSTYRDRSTLVVAR